MRRNARIAILVSLACAGGCLAAVAHFLLMIRHNQFSLSPESAVRDLYIAVGSSYTQGFVVGFFLCFSLAVAAVALSTWFEYRRRGIS